MNILHISTQKAASGPEQTPAQHTVLSPGNIREEICNSTVFRYNTLNSAVFLSSFLYASVFYPCSHTLCRKAGGNAQSGGWRSTPPSAGNNVYLLFIYH